MDIRKIRKLINLIKEQGIGEIEIKEGEESVRISQFSQASTLKTQSSTPKTIILESQEQEEKSAETSSSTKQSNIPDEEGKHIIRSPMIGTFYSSPTPNSDPFVTVGQHIKPGDVLCIVEAMKMFNQIESDCSGKIISCLVETGQPVEYGQPLFIVETQV
ncbi:MAG: acetyl-CoA carboxylase biotin carboxyl carrier protein [Gammaproteobacteria bacterium]|nr:acetyl-CoA carboxylase biotin carboxyl carrier protein [Gammaproteobacteria bacterium]